MYVIWTLYDATADPTAHPEWVGYDVLRRARPECDEYVRVNDEPIPRLAGQTHTRYFGEVVPATGTLYQYRVIAVEANHQQVFLPGFCGPCHVFQECPPFSTPVTIGTLQDELWGLVVIPCPGTCYTSAFMEGPIADELRLYAGTSTTFRFFGSVNCGGVEGCSLFVDHWEFATCVTPAATQSWGRLKTIYR